MRIIYLIGWVCLFLSRPAVATNVVENVAAKGRNSRIEGNIPGCREDRVFLLSKGIMTKNIGGGVVKEGRFVVEAALSEPCFLTLSVPPKLAVTLWVVPGQRITMEMTESGVKFTGAGKDINNMLAWLDEKYAAQLPVYSRTCVLDEERSGRLYDVYWEKVAEINSADLDETEKRLLVGYLQGELLNQLYGNITLSKIFGKNFPRPDRRQGYARQAQNLELLPEIVSHPQWKEGVDEWLYDRLRAGKIKIKSLESRITDMAAGLSEQALQEAYMLATLESELIQGNLTGIRERIAAVRSFMKSDVYSGLLEELEKKAELKAIGYQNAMPGTDVSHYKFYNVQGDTVTLGDFKGKYVFIDLWSTGCNPCIGEMPYIQEMERRFAGKPIVWVSLSMDLHEKVWKDFLEKHEMKGIQLLCEKGFKHPFCQQIELQGIPRFILLDKQGCIVDCNTLRPSNPVLEACLNLLLEN